MRKSWFASDSLNDDIIMAAIKVLASQTREVRRKLEDIKGRGNLEWCGSVNFVFLFLQTKQVEKLVQLLASERSKVCIHVHNTSVAQCRQNCGSVFFCMSCSTASLHVVLRSRPWCSVAS